MPDRECKVCAAEGITTLRPAPHPGPRCATHHRQELAARKKRKHAFDVGRRYWLEDGDYWGLYEYQGGKCAICKVATGKSRNLAVEHDHKKEHLGRLSVRGLCCSRCNLMLGHGRDQIDFFLRAVQYLQDPPAQKYFEGE